MSGEAHGPLLLGITGGIGVGKSEFARILSTEFGAPLIDADQLGHAALEVGTTTHDALAARFGDEILQAGGGLSRPHLARIVFNDPGALDDLNRIVHPWILERIERRRASLKASGYVGIILLDAALLLDWKEELDLDGVVVITAPRPVRIERLLGRGVSADEAERRMDAQRADDEWAPDADWIVSNDGDLDELARKAKALWAEVCARWNCPPVPSEWEQGGL